MTKLKNYIKENKYILTILLILFIVLCYCHFNTFLGNDDLPYSFFKRLDKRVTNLFQVVWDNLRYYKSTNGRFLVHCIVMTLLMFGKALWSIFNPLIITISIYMIYRLIFKKSASKKEQLVIGLILSSMFLMIYDFKNLIYWVAGSVNYLWVCCFILIFCFLYLRKDILDKKISYLLLFILSTLHENSFAFFTIFIITLSIIEYIKNKKFTYLKYIVPVLLGGAVLLLAPGNMGRNSGYDDWYSLSLFERLNISIPDVSDGIFQLLNIHNLVPTLYVIVMLLYILLGKYNFKFKIISTNIILIFSLLNILTGIKYISLLLAISCFIIECLIHKKNNEDEIIPIQFGFYAIAFSMVVTPLYNSYRPNILLYIYFMFVISKFLISILKEKEILKNISILILSILFVILCYFEINIYYNIGKVHAYRLKQMEEFKSNPSDTLYLKEIPSKYASYHQDCNAVDENFWTYRWFLQYYNLPDNIKIRYN